MISIIHYRILTLLAAVFLIACQTGCKDMFTDPLKDKETGRKLTILLMDPKFITTKIYSRLEDAGTRKVMDQEPVEIRFSGKGAAHLITFDGDLMTSFNTSAGFIEVGHDPNYPVNDQYPLELTVIAVSLNYISAPQFLSFTTEGVKNLTIKMLRKTLGKSVSTGPYGEPYDISYNGVLHSAQLSFISDIGTSSTGTAWDYISLYSTTANGTILCNNLKDNIVYSDYGSYYFSALSGLMILPPATPTKNAGLQNGDFVYSAVIRTGLVECATGLTIHTDRADGKNGTGVFDYLITFSDGSTRSGQVTCSFPSDNLIEQLYYPSSNPAVSVSLIGDAQYDLSAAVNLASPCGTTANFTATPKSSLKTYKLITQYVCSDTHIGLALTIIGEFRKTGTTNPWTSFEFVGGICEVLLEPGADYDIRINIDSEYYEYTIPIDPVKVETFLIDNQGDDYTIITLVVTSTATMVEIDVSVEFDQGVCDKFE